MTRTDVDLTKFMGMHAYDDVPIVSTASGSVYLSSTASVVKTVRSCMEEQNISRETLAEKSGISEDSLTALLNTGVTRLRDAMAVFRCLGLKVTALPPEYAKAAM